RVDRAVNQSRAVVGRDDVDTFGQAGLQLLNLFFDSFSDGQRVLAVPHQHHAAGDFVAVFLVHAAAELRPQQHASDIAHIDRSAVHFFDDGGFDVFLAFDPADAAHDVLGVILLNDATSRR